MSKDTITKENYERLLSAALVAEKPTKRIPVEEILSGELGDTLAAKIYNDRWTYEDVSDWLSERLVYVDKEKLREVLKTRLKISGTTVNDNSKQDAHYIRPASTTRYACPYCHTMNQESGSDRVIHEGCEWMEYSFHCHDCDHVYKLLSLRSAS